MVGGAAVSSAERRTGGPQPELTAVVGLRQGTEGRGVYSCPHFFPSAEIKQEPGLETPLGPFSPVTSRSGRRILGFPICRMWVIRLLIPWPGGGFRVQQGSV